MTVKAHPLNEGAVEVRCGALGLHLTLEQTYHEVKWPALHKKLQQPPQNRINSPAAQRLDKKTHTLSRAQEQDDTHDVHTQKTCRG